MVEKFMTSVSFWTGMMAQVLKDLKMRKVVSRALQLAYYYFNARLLWLLYVDFYILRRYCKMC